MTVFLAILCVLYAHSRWMQLKKYEDSFIAISTNERGKTELEIMSSSMGFNTAFAITAYDDSPDAIEDEDIGILKPYYVTWGENNTMNGESLSLSGYTEIPTRPCIAEDFGLNPETLERENTDFITGGNSKFYPVEPFYYHYLKTYFPKMKCIDDEIYIYGDYNSKSAQVLNLIFEACDPEKRSTCKSEEEITAWLKRKYIITVENTNVYRMHVYNESRVTHESHFKWYPISTAL